MNAQKTEQFRDVLSTVMERSLRAWVYLPKKGEWNLDSEAATLESDEVPPDLEGELNAGLPHYAKMRDLTPVVPVVTLQDIVSNLVKQKPNAALEEMFSAFEFYNRNDAFIKM